MFTPTRLPAHRFLQLPHGQRASPCAPAAASCCKMLATVQQPTKDGLSQLSIGVVPPAAVLMQRRQEVGGVDGAHTQDREQGQAARPAACSRGRRPGACRSI